MPSEIELQAALDEVAGYVDLLDHELVAQDVDNIAVYENEDGDEYSLTGHRCSFEDATYLIAGHPELEFMAAVYLDSINGYIRTGLTEDSVSTILDGTEREEYNKATAADELLNRIDDETMEALDFYLHSLISGDSYRTSIEYNVNGNIDHIVLERKLFPYHSDFTVRRYNDAVTSVISPGKKATKAVPRTIGLVHPADDTGASSTDYELSLNFGW
ncbi:hypothetical protein B4589_015575 (plasmid) [Halolamina sp. CBA1230]|uniref:hypothetical protein n=1 Tax=Halolamina sp. CBA1230 TaxID=1853690 RepID=UPI0009A19AA5|nr:hypothetical protein [Halolamina sp. CBA1230]QKY21839.1 hypothetical protein B4589_015575 [Halolamina sp. CBA1230]